MGFTPSFASVDILSGLSFCNPFRTLAVSPSVEENLAAETPYLRAFLRKLVLGTAGLEVDDLLQETMNRALQYSHTYDANQALRPWLQRIGFRAFLDARAKAKRQPSMLGRADALEFVADDATSPPSTQPQLEIMLQTLPEIERKVITAFYLQQFSLRDVALELRMAEGTVKSHLHRARKRLADRYQVEDWLG